jgi:hypothetical protein
VQNAFTQTVRRIRRIVAVTTVLAVCVASFGALATPAGAEGFDVAWAPRASMATAHAHLGLAAAPNGKLYAVGGYASAGAPFAPLATVEEYDPATDTWTTKAPMPTARYVFALATGANGKLYAVGGEGTGGAVLASVEEYDPATNTWATRTPMPTARFDLGLAAAANGKLYAVGGHTGTHFTSTVEEYDPATDTWTPRAAMPIWLAAHALVAAANGRLYTVGGTRGSGVPFAGTYEYDPGSDAWTARASLTVPRYYLGAASAPNGKLYAVGGWNASLKGAPPNDKGTQFATVEEYDPLADQWTTRTPLPQTRRGLGLAAATNGNLYAAGGVGAVELATLEVSTFPDTTPPIVDGHADVTAEAAGPSGTAVTYAAPATHDAVDGDGVASCAPASGSTFPLGNTNVSCTAADRAGNVAAPVSFAVRVVDTTAPTASVAGTTALDEGGTGAWTVTASDLVSGALAVAWDLDGDGSFADATGASTSRGFAQNGTSAVKARVSDQAGNAAVASHQVLVSNVAPIVTGVTSSINPVAVNVAVGTTASFADPGTADTHTATFEWGDGSTSVGTVTEASGSGIAAGSHTYTTPGVYTVAATVADADGGSGSAVFQYLVVYDPSGGFVTGAGWITSPAGASAADPGMTGRAHFGFNSKYQNGASVPTGNTHFHFNAGNLTFRSVTYQWLVVAGARAQFKGSGTVNGTGDYGFLLTAVDGQLNGGGGDRFRIKIWEKASGAVVYDNQVGADDAADPSTVLGGGNIAIHH